MDKETLHFKIGLSSTSAEKRPRFSIAVDGTIMHECELSQSANVTEYFEFDVSLTEEAHELQISLLNKESTDTIQDSQGNIISDMLLNIDSIEVDDLDLGSLLWTASIYNPIYPEYYQDQDQRNIKDVTNCVHLGWNGVWRLPFDSPFYIWLLENL
jgi:hypothetical protein